jgi:hypothetical protein
MHHKAWCVVTVAEASEITFEASGVDTETVYFEVPVQGKGSYMILPGLSPPSSYPWRSAFVPSFVLTWVISNVAAAPRPVEILHHWYRVNYFFPSLHLYRTLITILTQGGYSKLHYILPVLAAWLVLLKCLSPLATKSRVRKA